MEMMTPSEKGQLESRLAALVANRPAISLRIAEARALGDLKENGDYHAARTGQFYKRIPPPLISTDCEVARGG